MAVSLIRILEQPHLRQLRELHQRLGLRLQVPVELQDAPPDLHTEISRLANPLMLQVESIAAKGFDAYKLQANAGLVPPMNRLKFNEAVAEAMTKGDVGPHQIITDRPRRTASSTTS